MDLIPIIFFGIFFAVGIAIFSFGYVSLQKAKAAEHWPTTPGEVVASDFVEDSDSDGTTYRAKVSYTYSVNGQEFTSERIAFGYSGSSGHGYHYDIHKELPVGTRLAVRYNPDKPEMAALSYGVNKSIIFLLVFGAVWLAFTGGMAYMMTLMESGGNSLIEHMLIYDRP